MKILKARVYDYYAQQEQSEYDANRKSAVGTGIDLKELELIIILKIELQIIV